MLNSTFNDVTTGVFAFCAVIGVIEACVQELDLDQVQIPIFNQEVSWITQRSPPSQGCCESGETLTPP